MTLAAMFFGVSKAADPHFTPAGAFRAVEVRVSGDDACARTDDGGVVCWGEGFEVVDGAPTWRLNGVVDAAQIELRGVELLVRRSNGAVDAWRIPTRSAASQALALDGVHDAIDIAVTETAACVVRADGTVACWGSAPWLPTGEARTAQQVAKLTSVTDLVCDGWGCCAVSPSATSCAGKGAEGMPAQDSFEPWKVRRAGPGPLVRGYDVACWTGGTCTGRYWAGGGTLNELATARPLALGYGHACRGSPAGTHCESSLFSVDLPPGVQVDLDEYRACAVLADGGVGCWGDNGAGVLGDGRPTFDHTPALAFDDADEVFATASTTCVRSRGRWLCAGERNSAVRDVGVAWSGVGDGQQRLTGVSGTRIMSIELGRDIDGVRRGTAPIEVILAAEDRIGNLFVAGPSAVMAAQGDAWLPIELPVGFGPVVGLAAPEAGICALDRGGVVACWLDPRDESGGAPPSDGRRLTVVPGLSEVVQLTAGRSALCGRSRAGDVACVGHPNDPFGGSLAWLEGGVAPIPALRGATDLAAKSSHLCAVVGGEVHCSGRNELGQVGRAPSDLVAEPVVVPLPSAALEVAVGDQHSCARLLDRSVWCWGSDGWGQLGRGRPVWVTDHVVRVAGSGGSE